MRKTALLLTMTLIFSMNCYGYGDFAGDIDKDGAITASDASMVLQYSLNGDLGFTPEQKEIAEVTGDLNITAEDSSAILSKALNRDFTLNSEKKVITESKVWDFTEYDMQGQDFVKLNVLDGLTIYHSIYNVSYDTGIYTHTYSTKSPWTHSLQVFGVSRPKQKSAYIELEVDKPGKLVIDLYNRASNGNGLDVYNNGTKIFVCLLPGNYILKSVEVDVEPGEILLCHSDPVGYTRIEYIAQ